MTAQNSWERRLRRALNKYNCRLHRIRRTNGEYIVEDQYGKTYCSSLLRVQQIVDYLRERYAE